MSKILKEMHFVSNGEDDGEQTPFGLGFFEHYSVDNQICILQDLRNEFPDEDDLFFDYETINHGHGAVSYAWKLKGV